MLFQADGGDMMKQSRVATAATNDRLPADGVAYGADWTTTGAVGDPPMHAGCTYAPSQVASVADNGVAAIAFSREPTATSPVLRTDADMFMVCWGYEEWRGIPTKGGPDTIIVRVGSKAYSTLLGKSTNMRPRSAEFS